MIRRSNLFVLIALFQVQGLNSQWQKYDSSREDYIRGLCQRLKETTGQGLMPGLGSVSTGLLHQEISRLNGLLEEKMSECERLGREEEEIRRQDQERIQTLEQQVGLSTSLYSAALNSRLHLYNLSVHSSCGI